MNRRIFIGLFVALIMVLPANAQGLSEFGAVQAGAAGLGAGLAASQNHGAVLRKGYEAAVNAQSALVVQNRAIQQYLSYGQFYEAKKQWAYAEQAYTYVLQCICKRDGPGSPAAMPALKHLVAVSKGQNKLDSAINYQKTVVAFTHAAPKLDVGSLFKEESSLSDMYLQKKDFANAEPVLQDAVKVQEKLPKLTPEQRAATLKVYGRVLRELNKIEEADAVDAQVLSVNQGLAPGTALSVQTPASSPSAPTAAAPTGAITGMPAAINTAPTDLTPAPVAPSATSTVSASPPPPAAKVNSDLTNSGIAAGAAPAVAAPAVAAPAVVAPAAAGTATSVPNAAVTSVPAAAASSAPAAAATSVPSAATSDVPAAPSAAAAAAPAVPAAATSAPVAAATPEPSAPVGGPAEPSATTSEPSNIAGSGGEKSKSPEAGQLTPAEKAN